MLLPLAAAIAAGFVLGKVVLPARVAQSPLVGRGGFVCMVAMLVSLGLRLGIQQASNPNWGPMFGRSIVLAIGTIAGSVVFAWPCAWWLPEPLPGKGVAMPNPLRLLGLALGSLLVGTLTGALWPDAVAPRTLEDVAFGFLMGMVFLFGLEIGSKDVEWGALSPRLLLVPLLITLGSTAGGCVTGLSLGFSPREGAGIGAGCGWYSCATIVLGELGGPELGSYALLGNLFREALALVVIPVMARWHRGLVLLAPAGCTAMDTTLPMLKQLGGERLGLMAFLTGVICSLLVPPLVPLVFQHLPGR